MLTVLGLSKARPPNSMRLLVFDRDRRNPKHHWIHAVGIDREHSLVEILCGLRFGGGPVEVTNVRSRFFDDSRRVRSTWPLVSGNDSLWLERLDLIQRRYPVLSVVGARFTQMEVNIVTRRSRSSYSPSSASSSPA